MVNKPDQRMVKTAIKIFLPFHHFRIEGQKVQSLVCIDKDESRNIFTDITSIILVDLFSFSNM